MLFYIILFASIGYLIFWLWANYTSDRLDKKWYDLPYEKRKTEQYPRICTFMRNQNDRMDFLAVIVAFMLFIGIIVTSVGYCTHLSFIKRYNAVYVMFESRGSFTDLERAAVFNKAADYNAERVELLYWNKAFFGIADPAIPDEIEDLKPIQ